jgi:hypothetical protein
MRLRQFAPLIDERMGFQTGRRNRFWAWSKRTNAWNGSRLFSCLTGLAMRQGGKLDQIRRPVVGQGPWVSNIIVSIIRLGSGPSYMAWQIDHFIVACRQIGDLEAKARLLLNRNRHLQPQTPPPCSTGRTCGPLSDASYTTLAWPDQGAATARRIEAPGFKAFSRSMLEGSTMVVSQALSPSAHASNGTRTTSRCPSLKDGLRGVGAARH